VTRMGRRTCCRHAARRCPLPPSSLGCTLCSPPETNGILPTKEAFQKVCGCIATQEKRRGFQAPSAAPSRFLHSLDSTYTGSQSHNFSGNPDNPTTDGPTATGRISQTPARSSVRPAACAPKYLAFPSLFRRPRMPRLSWLLPRRINVCLFSLGRCTQSLHLSAYAAQMLWQPQAPKSDNKLDTSSFQLRGMIPRLGGPLLVTDSS
jgi:hypothetical protein